jgi:mannosyltransferase OCH1-like enzyme
MNYIWLYWENYPGKQPPEFIKMCHESVAVHCSDNFEIIMVNPDNIDTYLPNLRKDLNQIQREGESRVPNIPIKTAYIRVALLHAYGGIWLDSDMVVMKNFKPIKDLLHAYDFVGYRHWQGHVVNNFLASNPAGDIISLYKNKLDSILNERKVLPWNFMGSKTITPIVNSYKNRYLFEKASFHPIPWYQKELFFKPENLDRYVDESTICCALFNDIFPEYLKTWSRKKILTSDILISKVFRRSLLGES